MTTIYQGNTHTGPTISVVTGEDQPFELASSTVRVTLRDPRGEQLLSHHITLDGLGGVVSSDGISLQSTSTAGVVVNTLTAVETAGLPLGWVRWFATLTDSTGNTWPIDEGAWEVATTSPDYYVVHGTTKRTIRRRILAKLGDLLVLRATADGSATTFIDQIHLVGESDAYRGRQLLITGGTIANLGEERYVTGSARSNRSLTMDYDLPASTQAGDEAELANFFGTGYRFCDVHLAIEAAIAAAADMAPEPVALDLTDAYDKDTGTVVIPDDWVTVTAVDWREAADQPWQALEQTNRRLASGWNVDRARRQVVISGERSRYIHGKAVRIYGTRIPGQLVHDDDVTGINSEWLVARSVAELSSAAYRRNPTEERRNLLGYDLENERMVRTRVTKRSAGAIRL